MNSSFFQSRYAFLLLVVLVVVSGLAFWREVAGTIKIRKEIARLEQQAMELEKNNHQLKSLVDYLNSPAYQERVAREQLNMQAPGEIAVALPLQIVDEADESQYIAKAPPRSNPSKWWAYFFGHVGINYE